MTSVPEAISRLDALVKADKLREPLNQQLSLQILSYLYPSIASSGGRNLETSIGATGLVAIWTLAFPEIRQPARHMALRCLANIVMLSGPMRRVFVDKAYPAKLAETIKASDDFEAFVAGRILIHCVADKSLDLTPYLESGLAEAVSTSVFRYSASPLTSPAEPTSAGNESLILLSTISAQYSEKLPLLKESLGFVLKILDNVVVPSPPLQSPIPGIINCLATMPFHFESQDRDEFWPKLNDGKIVDVFDAALSAYPQEELETSLPPIVTLLSLTTQLGPPEIKERLQSRLLPSEEDRSLPLGKGDSLTHKVIKLSTGAVTAELKKALGTLLMALSDGDPQQLIRNVGYGCASGLLFVLGIPIPPADGEAPDEDDGIDINPITGQRRDREPQVDLPDMTDEEKEREAERLFVLFERLRNTGVMNVENPITAAARSGQLDHHVEELDSDED